MGPVEFREMLRDHQDTKREWREMNAKLDRIENVIGPLLDELEDRYDGAPDSPTRWMGAYITALRNAIE